MEGSFAGFNPVRRRQDTIATKKISTDDGKAWTTARCNRLLRPLISRVSALGRLLPSENIAAEKPASAHRTKAENVQYEDYMRDDENEDEDDDEWAPVRKKLKRTYSARLGKGTRGRPPKTSKENGYSDIRQRMPFLVPGEISVPTPILDRTKGGTDQDIQPGRSIFGGDGNLEGKRQKRPKSRYLTRDGEAHFELSEILRKLRKKTEPSRYTLCEGIYNGLEALLKATMIDSEATVQERRGARSLFDSCLRKVPAVIKDEEEAFALEAGERSALEARDVSSEIYAEFEALGYGDRGWKHLRTIVRAHGIQIVGDAITQGLLRPEFARALVWLCVHTACLDEAEMLLSCLLEITSCPEPKSIHSRTCDEPAMIPFAILEKFASYTGRRSFQARQLTGLFVGGQLPLAWLATKEFGRVWTHVIQSSTSDADSATFLTKLIPLLCSSGTKLTNFASTEGVMLKALDATLASVLTALSAITLLDTSEDNKIPQSSAQAFQQSGTVLRQCLITCTLLPSPLNDYRASLVVFSNIIISPESSIRDSFNDSDLFWKLSKILSTKSTQRSNDSIASFICSVACCCGRGAATTGFNHLKLLHRRLRKFLENQVCLNRHEIREVVVDSAFAFARRHDNCEHLDYAEDIESEFHGEHMADLPRRLPTEAGADVSTGFRWEEGISEWVTATPAFSLRKTALVQNSPVEKDTQGDSSVRHNLRRGKHLPTPPMFTQVMKQIKLSQEQDFTSAVHRKSVRQNLPSKTELESFEISLTSMASNNSSFSSSQDTDAEHGMTKKPSGRVLRPSSHGLRSNATWHINDDASDDELSSSTTSWNASIKRNNISVIVLQEPTAKTTNSHRYSTRRKSKADSSSGSSNMPRKRVFDLAADDDSADELCQ